MRERVTAIDIFRSVNGKYVLTVTSDTGDDERDQVVVVDTLDGVSSAVKAAFETGIEYHPYD